MKDRMLAGGGTLFAAAATFAVAGRRKIELRSHEPAHPKRTAVVELRYGAVEICRPQARQGAFPCDPSRQAARNGIAMRCANPLARKRG